MSLEQITTDLLALSVKERARLAKVLGDSVDDFIDGRIEESWNAVVGERVAEAPSLIDSSDVHAQALKRLEEARKVSSSR